jgi:hypothetical protein
MKEMMDTNQANANASLKELKEDMKAIQDKMNGRQKHMKEEMKAQVGSPSPPGSMPTKKR